MLEWVDIPAGSVTIEDEDINYSEEYYVEAFRISKYPVTYAQFQAFINVPDGFRNGAWRQGLARREYGPGLQKWSIDNHPRENVTWYDAVAFCRWLSDKTRLAISLPTEQQWQRAAQGDDGRAYPWGDAFDSGRCNTWESGIDRTTPVDQYPNGASQYGVYDMAGNVAEWCLNKGGNPENTDLAGSAWRVVRGGSWLFHRDFVRCASRLGLVPGGGSNFVGFRVVVRPLST
jgi:formylglycine-generating enzyme required for sulfatase activity